MTNNLSIKKKIIFWIVLVAIPLFIFVGLPVATVWYFDMKSGHYSFRKSFKSINPGDKKSFVINLLGKPDEESKDFDSSQHLGFESDQVYRYVFKNPRCAGGGESIRYAAICQARLRPAALCANPPRWDGRGCLPVSPACLLPATRGTRPPHTTHLQR